MHSEVVNQSIYKSCSDVHVLAFPTTSSADLRLEFQSNLRQQAVDQAAQQLDISIDALFGSMAPAAHTTGF